MVLSEAGRCPSRKPDGGCTGAGSADVAEMDIARATPQGQASPVPAGAAQVAVAADGATGAGRVRLVYSNPQAAFASGVKAMPKGDSFCLVVDYRAFHQ